MPSHSTERHAFRPTRQSVKALTNAPVIVRGGASGGVVDITVYDGATHDFDDPGRSCQSVPANVLAKADTMPRALQIVKVMASAP